MQVAPDVSLEPHTTVVALLLWWVLGSYKEGLWNWSIWELHMMTLCWKLELHMCHQELHNHH